MISHHHSSKPIYDFMWHDLEEEREKYAILLICRQMTVFIWNVFGRSGIDYFNFTLIDVEIGVAPMQLEFTDCFVHL